ncbi:RagB/SusD family nutrient uptake outer membrane protein [Mucilaginibacter daejeonensis]|uniref:RagB/SusD family nutrient uptake outer membrane protein n=1 Tax=Mucilaginibacter daejeonensis TaxID=398049 RepID=UPI001D1728F6|nr:RagB/SusD family nutrient uptake outer membrane protein [Mucilaginibacter daejeonensis]UEG54159.1 RagB/SusD family nutrient uptake outer membrane protein [Mucilaginibacter daejeonensis]
MKRSVKILCSAAAVSFMLTMPTSCKKSFLDENAITQLTTEDFKTTFGLDGLSIGMYQGLRFHFNYEWAYATTNYGTDEFTVGGDRTEQMFNSYDANLTTLNGDVATVWDNMYGNINSANILIENVPLYYDGANKNTRLGEGYFMRGFDYFKLVKQFGGVPLKLKASLTIEEEFTRASAQQVYEQIIGDLTQAYNLLPATPAERGRITKWAAAHFLAKVYLFRASEINSDWNASTKQADLTKAIQLCDEIINTSGRTLATNFSDLWNFTTVDGPNETNAEIILAAEFSNNTATQGRYGNQAHLWYPSLYQNQPGMVRDLAGGREFQRLRSTDYALDVYDRVNDSRFWKSFKTRYISNNAANLPKWPAGHPQAGQNKFSVGQESILYIVNNAGDTRYTTASIALRAPTMYVRYFAGQPENLLGNHGNFSTSQYVTMSKFLDGSRNTVASQFGQRDGILARLGETYLIAAEAQGRLGNYAAALPYLNKLRDRAAYKEGEDRAAYVDGGIAYRTNPATSPTANTSYSDRNTYYESNNLPTTTTSSTLTNLRLNGVGDILNSTREFYSRVGAGSDADKFLAFILNERSRELMGEFMRWEDLARTRTLVARATAFNDEAKPIAPKHLLRPIPQTSYLDLVKKNGSPLTPAEKQEVQNPGW